AVLDVHDLFPGFDFEYLDFALDSGLAAGRREQLAVLRKGDGDDAVGEARDALLQFAAGGVPDGDLLEAPRDEPVAVRRIRHGVDQGQVGRFDGLAALSFEIGVHQRAEIGARGGVINMNLVPAAGGDGRFVGADGQGAYGVDVSRRQA